MRRHVLRLTGVVILLLTAHAALADTVVNLRVAVLDVERVRRDSVAVKGIRSQLSGYLEAYRVDSQKEEQALRASQEELARKRNTLPAEGYADERKKLEDQLLEAQDRVQRRRQALERVNAEAMEQVKRSLETIVTEVAAERQLTLILRRDQIVFVSPTIEITDEVLQRLDQRLPSVQIADPGG